MKTPTIERVKQVLNCKTNAELSRRIEAETGVKLHKNQFSRFRRDGFHGAGTEAIINMLVDRIEQ